MATTLDDNAAARAAILDRVRAALGSKGEDPEARAAADAYVFAHARGPGPGAAGDMMMRFIDRAGHMGSTIDRISSRDEIPPAVLRYLDALVLPPALAEQKSQAGVCWPELADLDWGAQGLRIESRPTMGHDRLGITGCFCAIAETGTLVFIPGADMHTASALLPDTHVVVLRESDVVANMEDAFARVRAARPAMPRAIHLISGPSRTGDIEQTIVLGAHGPYRVHILIQSVTAPA